MRIIIKDIMMAYVIMRPHAVLVALLFLLSHSYCLSLLGPYSVWSGIYNVSLTPREHQLGITLSIIGHNSRDSGISVLNIAYHHLSHSGQGWPRVEVQSILINNTRESKMAKTACCCCFCHNYSRLC